MIYSGRFFPIFDDSLTGVRIGPAPLYPGAAGIHRHQYAATKKNT